MIGCAALHLSDSIGEQMAGGINPDIAKALGEESGGLYFPISLNSGETLLGSDTFAELANGAWTPLAHHDGKTVIATRAIGSGQVFYCGTNLGGALDQCLDGAAFPVPSPTSRPYRSSKYLFFFVVYDSDYSNFIT